MEILGDGHAVQLDANEIRMVLRHLERFERTVALLLDERREALPSHLQDEVVDLERFLVAEEWEGSELEEPVADGRYCCQLRVPGGGVVIQCNEFKAWAIFAWARCAALGVWNNASATMQGGRCSDMRGC